MLCPHMGEVSSGVPSAVSARSRVLPPESCLLPPHRLCPHIVRNQAVSANSPLKLAFFREVRVKSNFMSGPHDNKLCILPRD